MADGALYDGHDPTALARLLDVPRVIAFESTTSTMDEAHALATAGAAPGTIVLADRQTSGRGRNGRRWTSESGEGVWMTLIERPNDPRAIDVLSIRLGLRIASALERYADAPVSLKWPNDIYVGDGKLAGILVEARWRAARIDWVAIGIGVNVRAPSGVAYAGGLRATTQRIDVLSELVPALRSATSARGGLTPAELEAFAARDMARGRTALGPTPGVVMGITPGGELLIDTAEGVRTFRDGSLTFAHAPA